MQGLRRDQEELEHAALLAILIPAVAIALCLCAGYVVLSGACDPPTKTIAAIDVGHDRSVAVHADVCWEVNRGIYYEASETGEVVIPRSFIAYRPGTEQYTFNVASAENQSVVAVYVPNNDSANELFIIIDFNTQTSWPMGRASEQERTEAQQRAVTLFEKLRLENPGLPRPSGLLP